MAYVPPHKRHSTSAPKPDSILPHLYSKFNKTLTLKNSKPNSNQRFKIAYADNSISRWFIAGSPNYDSIRLEPFDCDAKSSFVIKRGNDSGEASEVMPWVTIVERIMPDLMDRSKSAIESLGMEKDDFKISFLAKSGRVLFHGGSVDLESIKNAATSDMDCRKLINKSFDTNVPSTYTEGIKDLVLPSTGFDFDSEKERYLVKVFDESQPKSTISCHCTVNAGGALEIFKIELNPVRHLVVDISCLDKDIDLRLMLVTKKIMKTLDDEENECIDKLIKSAIIDPEVKGGLRWPLGKESVANRFNVVGAWHTKHKAFKNETTRIKFRYADRFDHKASVGEVSTEVTLKLTGISKHLNDGNMDENLLKEMILEAVKLIWDHFLSYYHPST